MQLFLVDQNYHTMHNQTIFTIVVIVALASISLCNGDTCTCTCCSGNSCRPTLQGTISVSSCSSTSCKAECQARYPSQCTNGAGSASYQCRSGNVATPNWVGVFDMANRCDTRTCCCPSGSLTLSRINNELRIQCQFAGQCPPSTYIDDSIPMPSTFNTQIGVLGNIILITLSEDSGTIQITNPLFPWCSESASRNNAISTTTTAGVLTTTSLLPVARPNWIGVFNMANRCDTRTCCCPSGSLTLSRINNELRIQCQFTGQCPPSTYIDDSIPMPSTFYTQIRVLGNIIQITLSEDSGTIQITNPLFPSCSDTASRNGAISTITTSLALVALLSGLISLKQFLM